jgi:hypothetical protein
VGWGFNISGSLGPEGTAINPPVQLGGGQAQATAGGNFTCRVSVGAEASCVGLNYWGTLGRGTVGDEDDSLAPVFGGEAYASIDSGTEHSCAIRADTALLLLDVRPVRNNLDDRRLAAVRRPAND